jgi:[FeFe] hydrogenase H-cluster maturation GTPase HydF
MSRGKEIKPHIGIFGRRNFGKSSLINALTGQDVAIVSEVAGTTTDPVKKSSEIEGIGPAILVDTAGIDDVGGLGEKRVAKSLEVLKIIDLGILVIAGNNFAVPEKNIADRFFEFDIPFIVVHNKSDLQPLHPQMKNMIEKAYQTEVLDLSTFDHGSINPLFDLIRKKMPETAYTQKSILGDLITSGDLVVMVTPIDKEAPEGRMILPQVQILRDILDNDAAALVMKERELDHFMGKLPQKPALVITDSQAFQKVAASVPEDIPLTSFSILLARFKSDFEACLRGTPVLSELQNGDRVLLLESCTHHVSCDDIGRTKIPRWISNFTGKEIDFVVVSGLNTIPGKITDYKLVIQCGGCVLTSKQLINRIRPAIEAGVAVSNYGMVIAYVLGIYNRAIAPFGVSQSASYL